MDGLARRQGLPALRSRHAPLVLHLRDAGRRCLRACAGGVRRRRRSQARGRRHEGKALVAGVSTDGSRTCTRKPAGRPSSTTARSARSCAAWRARARRDGVPARRRRRQLARYDGVVLSNGPGARAPREESAVVRELLGSHAGVRHLPRPPAARPRDRARDVQAAVRSPRCQPPGARARERPRARDEPEPRLRGEAGRRRGGDTVSLYDGTVEGSRARAPRPVGAIPPRGRARGRTTAGRCSTAGRGVR